MFPVETEGVEPSSLNTLSTSSARLDVITVNSNEIGFLIPSKSFDTFIV